jgi:hypothetical protein
MVVVADLELPLDQISDHGTRPHPAGVSRRLRSCVHQGAQHVLLILSQSTGRSWGRPRQKRAESCGFVPLEPAVH